MLVSSKGMLVRYLNLLLSHTTKGRIFYDLILPPYILLVFILVDPPGINFVLQLLLCNENTNKGGKNSLNT